MRNMVKCTVAVLVGLLSLSSYVAAAPGDGINVLDCKISPYVESTVLYDSNVLLNKNSADELDDTSLSVLYGVNLEHTRKRYVLSANLWGLSEVYDDLDNLDHNDFGDSISLNLLTPGGFNILVTQGYSDVEDVDYTTSSVENFITHRGGLRVSRAITDKMNANVGYSLKDKDYDADTLFGYTSSKINGSVDYGVTDKTALFVKARVESQDGEGNSKEGTVYRATLGAKSRQTAKLIASADVGILSLSSDDGDVNEVGFGAGVAWQAMDKTRVTFSADKQIEPASIAKNNYNVLTIINARVAYTLLDNLKVSLNAAYQEIDLENRYDDGGNLVKKTEDIVLGKVRLDYQSPMDFLKVFASVGITEQSSTVSRLDYSRQKVAAGVALSY